MVGSWDRRGVKWYAPFGMSGGRGVGVEEV